MKKYFYYFSLILSFALGFIIAISICVIRDDSNNKSDEKITYIKNENSEGILVAPPLETGAIYFIVDMNGEKIFKEAPNNANKLYAEKLMHGYVYVMNYKASCGENDAVTRYLVKIYGASNFTCYDMLYRPTS